MGKKIAGGFIAALASLTVLAPAAMAAQRFSVSFENDSTGGAQDSWVAVYDNTLTDFTGTTIQLVRNGTVVASATGGPDYRSPFTSTGPLSAGDQLHYTAPGVDRTWTYDGLPSLDLTTACIGSSSFTGKVNPAVPATNKATNDFSADVYPKGSGASGFTPSITSAVSTDGAGNVSVTTNRALLGDDAIYVRSSILDGDTRIFEDLTRKPTACVVPPAPVVATPTPPVAPTPPPTSGQLLAGLQGTLATQAKLLSKTDLTEVVQDGSVDVPFTFMVPGTVEFSWQVAGASARASIAKKKAKKAKAIIIAKGAKSLKVAGTAKVTLKLTKAGKKLLRKAKSVRITFTATFKPAAGGPVQKTATKFTLKRHAKKKAAKKSKRSKH